MVDKKGKAAARLVEPSRINAIANEALHTSSSHDMDESSFLRNRKIPAPMAANAKMKANGINGNRRTIQNCVKPGKTRWLAAKK